MDRIITLEEAAAQLRTPPATLRYWRHRNTGPRSFKVGRRVMYLEDDIATWLQRQYDTPSPAA